MTCAVKITILFTPQTGKIKLDRNGYFKQMANCIKIGQISTRDTSIVLPNQIRPKNFIFSHFSAFINLHLYTTLTTAHVWFHEQLILVCIGRLNWHHFFNKYFDTELLSSYKKSWPSPMNFTCLPDHHLTFPWPICNPYLAFIRRFWTSPFVHLTFTWSSPEVHLRFTWFGLLKFQPIASIYVFRKYSSLLLSSRNNLDCQ